MTVPGLGPLALFAMFAVLSLLLSWRGASLDGSQTVFATASPSDNS